MMQESIKKILKKIVPINTVNYVKRYILMYIPFEIASKYNGHIKQEYVHHPKYSSSVCIFSHYDKDNIIDEYVVYYLKKLSEQGFDIVFVSTVESLSQNEIEKILPFCRDVLVKENIGYDFGAWQTGISYLKDELFLYESVLLCNDSVYAPIYPFAEMFQKMQGRFDFWGVTDSHEIYHHLQSYFMVFDKKVVKSEVFQDIWKNYKVYKIKRNIILQYEIGLSQRLLKAGFSMGVYCPYDKLQTTRVRNASHYNWRELLEKFRCPMLKIELLRDNPKNIDISGWEEAIQNSSDYDVSLIKNHLQRMGNKL